MLVNYGRANKEVTRYKKRHLSWVDRVEKTESIERVAQQFLKEADNARNDGRQINRRSTYRHRRSTGKNTRHTLFFIYFCSISLTLHWLSFFTAM